MESVQEKVENLRMDHEYSASTEKQTTEKQQQKQPMTWKPLLMDANGDPVEENDDDVGLTEMESLCMNCQETGITRYAFVDIPYFRQLIVSSFECENCNWANNEVQFGGELQLKGCRYTLKVTKEEDLNRQLIKSDYASVYIPEIDLEIPPKTQRGSINTIEGILEGTLEGLQAEQEHRMQVAPEIGLKVAEFMTQLVSLKMGDKLPFIIIVDDPSGNSFIENPNAPEKDVHLKLEHYERSPTQDLLIGLQPSEEARKDGYIDDNNPKHKSHVDENYKVIEGIDRLIDKGSTANRIEDENNKSLEQQKVQHVSTVEDVVESSTTLGHNEVISIPDHCPHCYKEGESLTCMTNIPYFKEILIMAFDCAFCGYRNNEIKGGGAIPTFGTSYTCVIKSREDYKRDVLKSDSSAILIPEIDLEVTPGSLGGFYTTVEGLLDKVYEHLVLSNPFSMGDSSVKHHGNENAMSTKYQDFVKKLKALAFHTKENNDEEENVNSNFTNKDDIFPFSIVLKDPLGNSFISFKGLTPSEDSQLHVEDYERTWQENEDLGLHDILVENYANDDGQENKDINQETKAKETRKETDSRQKEEKEIVLSDNKLNPHVHGGDHPTPFAKGCTDNDFTLSKNSKTNTSEESKINTTQKVVQNQKIVDFVASSTFTGAKEGYVFTTNERGTGYYKCI